MRLFFAVFLYQRINFLGHHAFITDVVKRTGYRRHAFLDQDRINGEVTGNVPASLVAVFTTCEMRQGTVQDLVGQCELCLLNREAGYVFRVVIKGTRIGANGCTPFRVRRL